MRANRTTHALKLPERILLAWPNIVLFFMALVLLYLPSAADHPIVLTVVNAVETITQAPMRYARLSSFPGETRAVIALTVLMFVPQAFVTAKRWNASELPRKLLLEYRTYSPSRTRIMSWFGWPFLTAVSLIGFFFAARDPTWCQGCVNSSKPGLLLFILIGPTTLVLFCLAAIDWYRWRLSDRRNGNSL